MFRKILQFLDICFFITNIIVLSFDKWQNIRSQYLNKSYLSSICNFVSSIHTSATKCWKMYTNFGKIYTCIVFGFRMRYEGCISPFICSSIRMCDCAQKEHNPFMLLNFKWRKEVFWLGVCFSILIHCFTYI